VGGSTSALATTSSNTVLPTPIKSEIVQSASEWYDGNVYELNHINKDARTVTAGSWQLVYSGAPAAATGEIDAVSYSITYSHSLTGTLSVGKDTVQGQLGYTFGIGVSFSNTKYSAALKKGQYVKAYIINTYSQSDIFQDQYYYVLQNGVYTTYRKTGVTRMAYGNKAILPQIKFEYYNPTTTTLTSGISTDISQNEPFKTEYYSADNKGEYKLNNSVTK